jgi:hypothetical protein
MSTDLYKRVNYNDGEGVTHGDLNDSQTYLRALLSDQIIQSLVGNVSLTALGVDMDMGGQRGAEAPSHLAYTLHGGQAYLRPGSATNKVQISPGVLLQKIGNSTGDSQTVLAYSFVGTEEVSIAAGDATNPRVDLIQMKLEFISADSQSRDFKDATTGVITTTSQNKKQRVQCTLSVKSGTPAASPVYPDPDTGYVAVAGVVVNTNYATTTQIIFGYDKDSTNAVVHDQRMPLNVQGYRSSSAEMIGTLAWTVGANWDVAATNGTNKLDIICPKGGASGRIVGISFGYRGDIAASGGQFGYVETYTGPPSINGYTRNTTDTASYTSSGVDGNYSSPYWKFEGYHLPNLGPTVLPSATNKIGVPLWTNGRRCAVIQANSSPFTAIPSYPFFRLQSGNASGYLSNFTWFIAQGL